MMRIVSLLSLASLLTFSEGQFSLDDLNVTLPPAFASQCNTTDWFDCVKSNALTCVGTCLAGEDKVTETGEVCDDIQSACPLINCCSPCSEYADTLLACAVNATGACDNVDCGSSGGTAPVAAPGSNSPTLEPMPPSPGNGGGQKTPAPTAKMSGSSTVSTVSTAIVAAIVGFAALYRSVA